MEHQRIVIAALLFILMILLSNLVMYGIARGATRGDSRWMKALGDSIRKPFEPKDKSMDELRKRLEELKEKKKEE